MPDDTLQSPTEHPPQRVRGIVPTWYGVLAFLVGVSVVAMTPMSAERVPGVLSLMTPQMYIAAIVLGLGIIPAKLIDMKVKEWLA